MTGDGRQGRARDEFELGVEALGATRIGYSPLGEVTSSVRAWRDRDGTSLLRPLLGELDRHVSAADLGLLRLVVPRGGLVPDLLYPADLDPTITACGQLAGLRRCRSPTTRPS